MDFRLNDHQKELIEMARGVYARKLKALCGDHSPQAEQRLRYALAEQGLLGLNMPTAYGGQGLSLLDTLLIMQTLHECDAMLGHTLHRSTSGAVNTISILGSEAQKQRFIPPVCRGDSAYSIGITEPDAGSAATALTTKARLDGDHFVINGRKQMVSHILYTDHTLVYCRFGSSGNAKEIGAVLVPHDAPGFSKGNGSLNMNEDMQFELFFDDVRLPRDYVVMEGNAFGALINVYNTERLGGLVRLLAAGTASYKYALEYAKTRRQFNREIAEFQGIQWMLAEMRIKLDACELLIYRAASNAEAGVASALESSVAKVYTGQAMKEVCDDAIQILGGYGYQKSYPVEARYREVRGGSIYGGTSQIHKNMIAEHILERRISQWKS
jgi:alkylation response protein AidB-like acyl-CoA dehydrogenase